jgi:uncharacterized protein (TIRG00374 family)
MEVSLLDNRRVWFGAAVTGGFLALLYMQLDLTEMREALADANYAYLAPGIAIYFGSLYFRAYRWRYLLKPFAATRTGRLYPVVLVGYMANNLLPVRLGELVRSYFLSTREQVQGSTALATIIIERVMDGLMLLFLLAVATLFLPVSGLADRVSAESDMPVWLVITFVVVPFVAVFAVILIFGLYPRTSTNVAGRLIGVLPARARGTAQGLVARFIAGFEGLHRPGRLLTVLMLTLPVWLIEGTMYYIIAMGFDLQSSFDSTGDLVAAILVLTAVSNLATSIPSSSGSVGPFEFFGALALVFLGVGSGLATAYILVLHVALLLPVIVMGLLYLATQSVSLGQLARGEKQTMEDVS